MKIKYIKGGVELINEIKPLWDALNIHHQNNAINFADKLCENTFESRHSKFENDELKVFIEIVKKEECGEAIGYSICSINSENMGELDSLYVEKGYRKLDIGNRLMSDAMKWFKENRTKANRLKVAEGNEGVLDFYKKHGFETRFYVLEEVES